MKLSLAPPLRRHLRRAAPLLALPLLAITSAGQDGRGRAHTVPAPASESRPLATGAAATYVIDTAHSELRFGIRHLVSRVSGSFRVWSGSITVADPARWETAAIDVRIEAASIDTGNEKRDAHLRSDDFFAAARYSTITFRSTAIERAGDRARIIGDLTMRGVTRPVVLEGEFLGTARTAGGRMRVAFEATTTIDRLAFGVAYNRAVEAGGMLLGDDVAITIALAAVER